MKTCQKYIFFLSSAREVIACLLVCTFAFNGCSRKVVVSPKTTLQNTSKTSTPDTTSPVVNSFSMPASSVSLTASIGAFSATDNVGVTGYLITESSTTPTAGSMGWSASAPTTFTFSTSGARTAYAWAKDAAGNVSASRIAAVTITPSETIAPVINSFSMLSPSTMLTVPITALTATDNVAVTSYMITTSPSPPAASDPGWSGTPPTSFSFSSTGVNTAYAWAKDAAGNISLSLSSNVTIIAGTVKFAWDPPLTTYDGTPLDPTTIAGYKIQYGTTPGTYPNVIDVGNVTTYQLAGLTSGSTLYFVMTTYDINGLEGTISNEISQPVP